MFSKKSMERVVFSIKKTEELNSSIADRIYEKGLHSIPLSPEFNDACLEQTSLQMLVNSKVDHIGANTATNGDDIYLMVVSSLLYDFLIHNTKIPTNQSLDTNHEYLYECIINIEEIDDFNKHRDALNFLAFINVDIGKPTLLSEAIYNHIVKQLNNVNLVLINKHKIPHKTISIDTIDNPLDILSQTKQFDYRSSLVAALTYKSPADKGAVFLEISSIQHWILEQQLRFSMYEVLETILKSTYVRFNRTKSISDFSGNLFFRLSLPTTPIYKNNDITFKNLLLEVMDYGFFVSIPNLNGRISFEKNPKKIEPPTHLNTLNTNQELTNPLFSLLFSLTRENNKQVFDEIDNQIICKNYPDVENILKKLFS